MERNLAFYIDALPRQPANSKSGEAAAPYFGRSSLAPPIRGTPSPLQPGRVNGFARVRILAGSWRPHPRQPEKKANG
jgi:hypothetical protein